MTYFPPRVSPGLTLFSAASLGMRRPHAITLWVRLETLAARVGLSGSRLRHLFKDATGVPLRRYRLWVAMRAALQTVARGETLTSAAMDGGFASSAHFSAAFRDMFGMEPSRLARGRMAMGGNYGDSAFI